MKKHNYLLVLPIIAILSACGNNTSNIFSSSLSKVSNESTQTISSTTSSVNSTNNSVSSSNVSSTTSSSKNSISNSSKNSSSSNTPSSVSTSTSKPNSSSSSSSNKPSESTPTEISNITDLTLDGISYDATNKVFEITKGGEFIFKGVFEGNIIVNAGELDEVKVTLNGFKITSNTDSPIKCNTAASFQVSIKSGTQNYVLDAREHRQEANETQGNGAITSNVDMKLSGKGSLSIEANYFNGIHSKDDLKIKPESVNGSKVEIKSYNNCLKGNDSVEIENGDLLLISTDGNGVVTENSDVSSKGNQRGNIVISGGKMDIYASRDGLDAANNVKISRGLEATEDPIINIYTHKYSQYSNIGSSSQETNSKMYLKASGYSTSYYFGLEFKDNSGNITWVRPTQIQSGGGGGSRSSYFTFTKPNNATSVKVCYFRNSVSEMIESNAYAKMTEFKSINSSFNMMNVSVSGTSINLSSWSNYTSQPGPGGMQEGNSDKADYSAKGIKAHNLIEIYEGYIYVKAYDDTLHASYGDVLENGTTGEGKLNIYGGELTLYAADDALHADNEINIQGGIIDIQNSYEGIEANLVNIAGGYTKVYATDDGVNAANKVGKTPEIKVSDGILDVTVYGNDIDGIDSNGNYTQTGGYVITKGGTGGMSTGFDIDGTGKITGGTFIGMGPMENSLTAGTGITSYSLSGSWAIGNHKITLPNGYELTVQTKYSYSQVKVWSDSTTKIKIDA